MAHKTIFDYNVNESSKGGLKQNLQEPKLLSQLSGSQGKSTLNSEKLALGPIVLERSVCT